jgi:hypothetical protein
LLFYRDLSFFEKKASHMIWEIRASPNNSKSACLS